MNRLTVDEFDERVWSQCKKNNKMNAQRMNQLEIPDRDKFNSHWLSRDYF